LLGTTLRYPYEVRKAADYLEDVQDVKIPGEMLKLAEHILESKAADFDPSAFIDHYEAALVELLKTKQAGVQPKQIGAPVAERGIINLMDALRRSMEAEQPKKPAAQSTTARGAKKKRA
jgi:DNA end-binding protein Ku